MKRRHWLLGIAVLLFLAAAFLLSKFEKSQPERLSHREVNFPTHMRAKEKGRMTDRQTLPAPVVPKDGGHSRPRDPLLAALPRGENAAAVVIEANALRHSRIGELLIACMNKRENNSLAMLRERTGIDPLKDVDRVALVPGRRAEGATAAGPGYSGLVPGRRAESATAAGPGYSGLVPGRRAESATAAGPAGDAIIVSGFFDAARWDDVFASERREQYGTDAAIYVRRDKTGAEGSTVAVWKNQLVILADTIEAAKEAIDRVEGRGEDGPSVIKEDSAYGEIYGVVPASLIRRLVPASESALSERLLSSADRIEVHADAMNDVSLVASINGKDSANLSDLSKSLGSALTLARAAAQSDGKHKLAELLDYARVVPASGKFSLELALPAEVLERQLANCGK